MPCNLRARFEQQQQRGFFLGKNTPLGLFCWCICLEVGGVSVALAGVLSPRGDPAALGVVVGVVSVLAAAAANRNYFRRKKNDVSLLITAATTFFSLRWCSMKHANGRRLLKCSLSLLFSWCGTESSLFLSSN